MGCSLTFLFKISPLTTFIKLAFNFENNQYPKLIINLVFIYCSLISIYSVYSLKGLYSIALIENLPKLIIYNDLNCPISSFFTSLILL